MKRNPGFDGKFYSHEINNKGVVTKLSLAGKSAVSDIAPVSALTGLQHFSCSSTVVADLSPLRHRRLNGGEEEKI